jgi:hypothetical protein
MGDTCSVTGYSPYLWGLSFLKGVLILKLHAFNYNLLLKTKNLSGLRGLCNAFCALDIDSCNCLGCSCAAGTESSRVLIDAVRAVLARVGPRGLRL